MPMMPERPPEQTPGVDPHSDKREELELEIQDLQRQLNNVLNRLRILRSKVYRDREEDLELERLEFERRRLVDEKLMKEGELADL